MEHCIVTAGVVWKNNKVLIAKRSKGKIIGNVWEFPGGKVEKGERLRDCLKRELREELGIEVEVGEHLLSINHTYGHMNITLEVFSCKLKEGEVISPKEHEDVKWVEISALSYYNFADADKKIVDFLKRFKA